MARHASVVSVGEIVTISADTTPGLSLSNVKVRVRAVLSVVESRFMLSLRSLNATFKTRTAGTVSLEAAWPPATTPATVTLSDASGAQAV